MPDQTSLGAGSSYAMASALATMGWVLFFIVVVLYLYFAYTLYVMAKKTNTPNAWLAWIPFANIFLFVKVAGQSYWWILLLFVPFVNIIVSIWLYMELAKHLNHPSWLGILMIVPIINLVIPAYLAFVPGKMNPGAPVATA